MSSNSNTVVDDPDVYLLVTLASEAGDVLGEIAFREAEASEKEVEAIRAALDQG
ncbi:hypothetical protein AB0L06_41725 [Spirillospora sp. NPDC052269]